METAPTTQMPVESGEPPRFVQPITSIDTEEGQRVMFETIIAGQPAPEVKWYREQVEITKSLDFQVCLRDLACVR